MNNDFNNLTGCWPETYFIANKEGTCKWKSYFDKDPQGIKSL